MTFTLILLGLLALAAADMARRWLDLYAEAQDDSRYELTSGAWTIEEEGRED